MVTNQRSDACILARQHLLQVLLALLGIVLRIRIQRLQHGVNTCRHHLVGIQRIDIHHIQMPVQRIEYLQIFCHLKVVIHHLLGIRRQSHQTGAEQQYQVSFHHLFPYICLQNYKKIRIP